MKEMLEDRKSITEEDRLTETQVLLKQRLAREAEAVEAAQREAQRREMVAKQLRSLDPQQVAAHPDLLPKTKAALLTLLENQNKGTAPEDSQAQSESTGQPQVEKEPVPPLLLTAGQEQAESSSMIGKRAQHFREALNKIFDEPVVSETTPPKMTPAALTRTQRWDQSIIDEDEIKRMRSILNASSPTPGGPLAAPIEEPPTDPAPAESTGWHLALAQTEEPTTPGGSRAEQRKTQVEKTYFSLPERPPIEIIANIIVAIESALPTALDEKVRNILLADLKECLAEVADRTTQATRFKITLSPILNPQVSSEGLDIFLKAFEENLTKVALPKEVISFAMPLGPIRRKDRFILEIEFPPKSSELKEVGPGEIELTLLGDISVEIGREDRLKEYAVPTIRFVGGVEYINEISSRHLRLDIRNGQVFLSDLGSTNGSTINQLPMEIGTLYELRTKTDDGQPAGYKVVLGNHKAALWITFKGDEQKPQLVIKDISEPLLRNEEPQSRMKLRGAKAQARAT
jgi:hypothetical protein